MPKQMDDMSSSADMNMDEAEVSRGTVEALARNAVAREAERMQSININMDAALYRTAQDMNLGELKTDEIRFSWAGTDYIAQGFTDGILYVEDGKWDQVRRIDWGTTKDAAEGGKTEGAISTEPGITPGGEASGEGRGDRGPGLSEG